ncbi:MAG: FlgD immunoglobulin-like domain containing protein [Bacteroidota bacterium]
MKVRRVLVNSALILVLYTLVQAQSPEDKYPAKAGENMMRVVVSNRTQTPLSGLTIRFAESQPQWFAGQGGEQFDLDSNCASLIELPFQINPPIGGTLTEAVTLQLLAQDKVLGTISVKLSPEGVSGKTVVNGSIAGNLVEENSMGKTAETATVPTEFALKQNYPNPFNPSTVIQYDLPQGGSVLLEIYDPLGRMVRTLVRAEKAAGSHAVFWDGTNDGNEFVPSGVYFYRLVTPSFVQTRKMLLVR